MMLLKITCGFILVLSMACSKPIRETNSEPENKSIGPRPAGHVSDCRFEFKYQMTPSELASIAIKMKNICNLTESEILNRAAKL